MTVPAAGNTYRGAFFNAEVARGRVEGDRWILSGKLFEAGDYPDKQFAMTESELAAAAARFRQPKPVKDEHQLSWFNGRLGEVIRVEAKGRELVGDVAFPLWMKEAAGDSPIGLSCEWLRDTKDLDAVALTLSPRVHDAVLFSSIAHEIGAPATAADASKGAAGNLDSITIDAFKTDEGRAAFNEAVALFAKKRTYEGQSVLQSVHDQCARAGAVCTIKSEGNGTSNFHTAGELNRIQELHDIAVKGGAKCSSGDGRPSYGPYFSNTTPTDGTRKDTAVATDEKSLLDKIRELISGSGKPADQPASTTAAAPNAGTQAAAPAAFNNDPALMSRLKAAEQGRIDAELTALVAAGHIIPALTERVRADFNSALEDDIAAPRTVKFSVNEVKDGKVQSVEKEGSRLDARIAFYRAMPKHSLFNEQVGVDANARVLLSDETPEGELDDVDKQAERIATKYKPQPVNAPGSSRVN